MEKNVKWSCVILILICFIATCIHTEASDYDPAINDNIASWFNEDSRIGNNTTFGPLDCNTYITENWLILSDSITKELVMTMLRCYVPKNDISDIGKDEAFNKAKIWMDERHIDYKSWTLYESKTYEHGSAGRDYRFTWTKFNSDNIQLPSLMKIVINQNGETTQWYKIDKPVEVLLTPIISSDEANVIANSIYDKDLHSIDNPKLRVWFDGKEQILLWSVKKSFSEDNNIITVTFVINANTGKILYILKQ